MENHRFIPKGTKVYNEDGSLYCTFMKDYNFDKVLGLDLIQYADGSKPAIGEIVEAKVSNFISEFSVK